MSDSQFYNLEQMIPILHSQCTPYSDDTYFTVYNINALEPRSYNMLLLEITVYHTKNHNKYLLLVKLHL